MEHFRNIFLVKQQPSNTSDQQIRLIVTSSTIDIFFEITNFSKILSKLTLFSKILSKFNKIFENFRKKCQFRKYFRKFCNFEKKCNGKWSQYKTCFIFGFKDVSRVQDKRRSLLFSLLPGLLYVPRIVTPCPAEESFNSF